MAVMDFNCGTGRRQRKKMSAIALHIIPPTAKMKTAMEGLNSTMGSLVPGLSKRESTGFPMRLNGRFYPPSFATPSSPEVCSAARGFLEGGEKPKCMRSRFCRISTFPWC
jgi:hypothetical protein